VDAFILIDLDETTVADVQPVVSTRKLDRWLLSSRWMRDWNAAFDAAHNAHHAERNETCLMDLPHVG
jgi:hypothetical protein